MMRGLYRNKMEGSRLLALSLHYKNQARRSRLALVGLLPDQTIVRNCKLGKNA